MVSIYMIKIQLSIADNLSIASISAFDTKKETIFANSQKSSHGHLRRNLCLRSNNKTKFLQYPGKNHLHLKQCKSLTHAVTRTVSKRLISVRVTWLFGLGAEAFWVKLVRIWKIFWIMMDAIDWDKYWGVLFDMKTFDGTVLCSYSWRWRCFNRKN